MFYIKGVLKIVGNGLLADATIKNKIIFSYKNAF